MRWGCVTIVGRPRNGSTSSRGRTAPEPRKNRGRNRDPDPSIPHHHLMGALIAVLAMDETVRVRFPFLARNRMCIEEFLQPRMAVHVLAIVDQTRVGIQLLLHFGMLIEVVIGARQRMRAGSVFESITFPLVAHEAIRMLL